MSTDGYRHEKGCAWSGMTLERRSLNDRLCVCDPHGTKARAHAVFMERWNRRHVLMQDEVWYPKEGDPVRLDEMSLRWKKNLLAFLERRAEALKMSAELELVGATMGGEHAQDAVDQILAETLETKATTWLYQQPLVEKLEQLIREGHDGPVDRFDAAKAEATS